MTWCPFICSFFDKIFVFIVKDIIIMIMIIIITLKRMCLFLLLFNTIFIFIVKNIIIIIIIKNIMIIIITLKRMCLLILLLNGAVMVTGPSTAGAMERTEPTMNYLFNIIISLSLFLTLSSSLWSLLAQTLMIALLIFDYNSYFFSFFLFSLLVGYHHDHDHHYPQPPGWSPSLG